MERPHNAGDFTRGVLAGVLLPLVALFATVVAVFLASSDSYNLDHWKLNVRVPPVDSLWMDLGFWYCPIPEMLPCKSDMVHRKSPSGDPINHFDGACAALLRMVLSTAQLIDFQVPTPGQLKQRRRSTKSIARLLKLSGYNSLGYVRLTLNESQLRAAQRRKDSESAKADSFQSIRLFGADAAKPGFALAHKTSSERWLLALDCLYHFSPSRDPIFRYAAQEFEPNVVTFDLILNKSAPLHQRLIAQTVESVIIRDVTDDVFPGLVNYLKKQEAALANYSISIGVGFRLARKVFAWFERTSVVKSVIVVAQTSALTTNPSKAWPCGDQVS
ncbi:hypothetical protein B0T14DRAFT_548108 [Immersiella caudata]|uniref:Uncharacterized protein n=1 Tax=Immersiella caudata TaxID=314043 RepID=A0AA40BUX6_9PEZI|nr:hypothetical protein B0T14DRAFT_548108 [Immersiella caudata]